MSVTPSVCAPFMFPFAWLTALVNRLIRLNVDSRPYPIFELKKGARLEMNNEEGDFEGPEEEASKNAGAAPGGGEEKAEAAAGGDNLKEKEQDAASKKAAPGAGADAAGGGAMIIKRNLCKHWQESRCRRGELCGWAHGQWEIGDRVPDPQELKMSLCRFFSAGNCRNQSEECEFAHGQHELGKKKPAVLANHKKGGKVGKGKAGGKMKKNADRSGERKRSRARSRARRSNSKGGRARRSDSRSQVLPIIIQTCSLFPLHQDKTLSAK